MRQARRAAAGTALAVAMACVSTGCGSATTDQAAPASTAAADGWASVVALGDAVAANDWAAAGALASPGSPAAQYVDYRQQVQQAQQQAGAASPPTGTVQADEGTGAVAVTIEGDDSPTFTWSDFATDDTGLVETWRTEQGLLDEVLVSPSSTADAAGATVTLTHAYRAVSGDLVVVVQLSTADETITPDQSVLLTPASGTPTESSAVVGPDQVDPGGSGFVVYTLPGADPAGTLVYEVQNASDAPAPVELSLS